MRNKSTATILIILFIGILYRLFLTADGNFIFNMDNARDMVDVREMVILQKPRLTGPTSAIEGFFNGPAWYYLLSIPFVISQGDPYASILMQILLWAVGGFFLLKLVNRWSYWLLIPIGAIWIASDYILLANRYAFNPNPVTLLTPLFLYLLVEYLKKEKVIYGIMVWVLGGLFFNFEMNFGVFIPSIILTSVILTKKFKLLKEKGFWIGIACFTLTLLPQIIFDLKHQFIMSTSILRHLSADGSQGFDIVLRFQTISRSFYNTFLPILLNHKLFTTIILILFIPTIYLFLKEGKKEVTVYVSLVFIVIPFLGYLILPVNVNPWHLGAEMVALAILVAYLLKKLLEGSLLTKLVSFFLSFVILWFALVNISSFFRNEWVKPSSDPSLFRNEIAAIDYVYKKADGKNFKVYTYLPSVIDYPYQYLIWWYGLKNFGYLPAEYAYAPNKPKYISNKEAFSAEQDQLETRENSNLVFLIKEPDRNYTRSGWEGDFIKLKSLGKEMVGPLEIEIKREASQ